jgi:taurine dioxygenase
MSIQVERLAYGLGAAVTGIDLAKPLDAATRAAVQAAWLEHLVLVFPGQPLDMQQQIAFSRNFGELELHPEKHYRHPQFPEIFEITNRTVNGKRSETAEVGRTWHSDGAFTLRPPTGSLLHCREIPAYGGDTWFSNMYLAYERLSDTMKRVIDGLEVVNDLGHYMDVKNRDPSKTADHLRDNPPVVQPLVRVHPETGRKALYLNETVTRQIHGMTMAESEGLLRFLFAHQVRPEFTYRHHWRRHDLVLWDNRCTMHLAPKDYDHSQLRLMCRTTLIGKPLGYLYGRTPATAAAA